MTSFTGVDKILPINTNINTNNYILVNNDIGVDMIKNLIRYFYKNKNLSYLHNIKSFLVMVNEENNMFIAIYGMDGITQKESELLYQFNVLRILA